MNLHGGGLAHLEQAILMKVTLPNRACGHIELPEEDVEGRQRGMVGRLKKALYGTRDAPLAWQEALTRTLKEMGFQVSSLHPALFYHSKRDMCVAIHVDDMLCSETH